MKERVAKMLARLGEVENLLGEPGILSDQKRYKELTQEHSYLSEVKEVWMQFDECMRHLVENQELLKTEEDPDFLAILKEEIELLERKKEKLLEKIEVLLVPPSPLDSRNIILELRAGTGGEEAAIFVGDCARMYKFYADHQGWSYELLSATPSEAGGFKECIMSFSGPNVYRFMQYEAGTHRVQRVPKTETQGRVHTSAITVAVLLEPDEEEKIAIDESELRVDTYRSSGAGGQHVNTTDSAVRLTHIPTGTVVYCQEERSQHKNKDKAMRLLVTRLAEVQREKQRKERADLRSSQVGSGDRSERIRTYNFPQNRVTDHRIDMTLYSLDRVMEGELHQIPAALVAFYHKKALSGEGE